MTSIVDELHLAASLDDTWRTPIAIKRKFKIPGQARLIAAALERLAKAGSIERRAEQTKGIRLGNHRDRKPMSIEFFRRRQYGQAV